MPELTIKYPNALLNVERRVIAKSQAQQVIDLIDGEIVSVYYVKAHGDCDANYPHNHSTGVLRNVFTGEEA